MAYHRPRPKHKTPIDPWKKVCLWIVGVWLGLSMLGVLAMGDGPSGGIYLENQSDRIIVACLKKKNGGMTMQTVERGEKQYLAYPSPELAGELITLLDKGSGQVAQRIRITLGDLRKRFHTFTYYGRQ